MKINTNFPVNGSSRDRERETERLYAEREREREMKTLFCGLNVYEQCYNKQQRIFPRVHSTCNAN